MEGESKLVGDLRHFQSEAQEGEPVDRKVALCGDVLGLDNMIQARKPDFHLLYYEFRYLNKHILVFPQPLGGQ